MGITVAMKSRPVVQGVVLAGTRHNPTLVDAFDLRTTSDDLSGQLDDLGRQLSSRLIGLAPETAVVRIADFSPVAKRTSAPQHRLMIEGALSFVCKARAPVVLIQAGKDIGQALGVTKEQADTEGRGLDSKRATAAAAALGALPTGS